MSCVGYDPKVSFEEGIARTAQWYLQAQAAGLLDDGGAAQSHPHHLQHHPLDRSASDLELSSFVEKAPNQLRQRRERVFKAAKNSSSSSSSSAASSYGLGPPGFSSPHRPGPLRSTRSSGRLSAATSGGGAGAI